MNEEKTMSHWIMGILSAFGLALALFAILFCWWMIKTAYDEAEKESAGR
jgi:hypothetical protein